MRIFLFISSFWLLGCGGFSDFTDNLPGGYKYYFEGDDCANAILDSKNRIKYPWVKEIKYNAESLNFLQVYSLKCQENTSELVENDSIYRKKRVQYYIYLEKSDTWFSNMPRKRYLEVFDSLNLPEKLKLK